MNKYLTEFIGTFFLVLVIAFSGNPLAIAAVLIAMVYMGGYISGAHYNPAVTLAVWLNKKMDLKEALIYMAFQMGAAIAATLIFHFIFGVNRRFVPAPDLSINPIKPLLIEMLFTFALVLVVLNVTSPKSAGNQYYGLAIGFTVMAAAYAGGSISGGAFNPAVGIGPLLVDAFRGGNNLGHAWLYAVGPFGGAILATLAYKLMYGKE